MNNTAKAEANAKNCNRYLAWAFFEAAHFAIQFLPAAKRFYEKKARERKLFNGIFDMAYSASSVIASANGAGSHLREY